MKAPKKTTHWEGVRNYQARNFLRDQMKKGDKAFFYHSNCEVPGIVGIVEIVKSGYPDPSAFDPESKYFDPTGTRENPRWFMVDVKFIEKFKEILPLTRLKAHPKLQNLRLVKPGNRLSVLPVSAKEWEVILSL